MDDFIYCLLIARRRARLLDAHSRQKRTPHLQAIRKLRRLRDFQRQGS